MSSVSFANKLFNRLDNGLLYDEETIYEMKEIDISEIGSGNDIKFISIYNDNIYFVSDDNYKEIKHIDINSEDHSYNVIKTVNNDIKYSFVMNDDNIYYSNSTGGLGAYETTKTQGATETKINLIHSFVNINPNNQILFYTVSGVSGKTCISNINEIKTSSKWTDILTERKLNSYINNNYFIYYDNNNNKIRINIKNLSKDETTSINTENAYVLCYCFANDSIFGYINLDKNKVYILSIAEFEASKDKSSLSFTEVANLVGVNCFYITNKWFAYGKEQKIYYCPVEYLYNPEHKITQQITQMDLLYSIDKKLNTLTDLLEQFKVPEN